MMSVSSRIRVALFGTVVIVPVVLATLLWPGRPSDVVSGTIAPSGVPVITAVVEQRDVPHRIASVGTVQSLHTVVIRPQISGVLAGVMFREGEIVPRGAALARIDDRAVAAALAQARAEKASRDAQLKSAELDLARYGSLVEQQIIPRQQLDQQAALVERLRAELLASEAMIVAQEVQLSHTRISSPVGGRVGIRRVDPGNLVQPSDPEGLVTVTQLDPISIVFTLPQEALPRLALVAGRPGPVVTAFDHDAGSALAKGSVTTFDNRIDPASGTLRMRAEFRNPDGRLWPGQFVALRLETAVSPGAKVFPTRAVQQGLNGPFVFRVADSRAEVVPVSILYQDDEITAVSVGLEAGDTVVVDGQSRLKPGTVVRTAVVPGAGSVAGG